MSCLFSDLEEGEIPDDSPSSPRVTVKKGRELPRRYILRENKSTHKHKKKDCKYSIRYHAKKLSKLKKTPTKDTYKKHRKSCPHDKSHKHNIKKDSPASVHLFKNGHSFPKHSLISEMNSSFKDLVFKKNLNSNKSSTHKNIPNTKNKTTDDIIIISETSVRKKSESQLKSTNDYVSDSRQYDEHYIEKVDDLLHINEFDSSTKVKDVAVSHDSLEAENEESEDEEELRRIALATCAKRKLILEPPENLDHNINGDCIISVPESSNVNVQISPDVTSNLVFDNYEVVDMELNGDTENSVEVIDVCGENLNRNLNSDCIISVPESSNVNVEISPDVTSTLVFDNYEVVDMEVDEDAENSVQIIDDESLFVIDTKPSSTLEGNVKNSVSGVQHASYSDEDFEADILRAELIGSMFRKRAVLDEQLESQKVNAIIYPKQMPVSQENKNPVIYQKRNVNLHHKLLQPAKRILRKNGMKKSVKLKCNSGKLTRNTQVNRSPKRLIITLNGESSSEESDDAEEVNPVPENPVASIEALISDCRQKSDSSEKANEIVNHVPKAVSCLSKAQQEEYNSLLKILAKKKKLLPSQETSHHNNGTVHSPLDDLKLLEEKVLRCKETLQKKKSLIINISKDVNAKKQIYMKSKLSAQHLKEQYVAAEKVRRIKLDEWFKSCRNLEDVKKSVSSLETKSIQLQNLYSKLGSSVQGQIYDLPSLPTDNGQL